MEITNFTGDGHQTTIDRFEEPRCSAELTEGTHPKLIILSIFNIFLSISAFLGNTLILVALHKESSLHPATKVMFRSLAITDLCVGVIVEPLAVSYWISVLSEQWNICRYILGVNNISSYMFCFISLVTLTAMSVDRLIALLSGIRYRQIVTLKRTCLTVLLFWIFSIAVTAMSVWNALITEWTDHIIIPLCLLTSIFSYTKIFLRLRHHQARVHVQQGQPIRTSPLNMARYRKAVFNALWLQLALVACYLPFFLVEILWNNTKNTTSLYVARQSSATLIYLNSSVNPILYCWKIREVRQAVKDTIRQLCCSSS